MPNCVLNPVQNAVWHYFHFRNGKVVQNINNREILTTEIAYNVPIFTAVTRNHGSGQKSWYTAKITVITAIVNSWFSYSPSHLVTRSSRHTVNSSQRRYTRRSTRHTIFTRDSIYAIARICYGNSVCPSVCHTGGSVKNGWS